MLRRILVLTGFLALAAGIMTVVYNGATAKEAVERIMAADRSGAGTTEQIAALKTFVGSHMGSSVSFSLADSYARADAAAKAAATGISNLNEQLYAEAQRSCSGRTDSVTQAKCVQNYVSQRLVTVVTPTPAPAPNQADYQYVIEAPLWSADLAGLLLAGGAALMTAGIIMSLRRRLA